MQSRVGSSRWVEQAANTPRDDLQGNALPPTGSVLRIERDFQVVIREVGDRVSEAEARRVFDSNEHDIVNTIFELQDYNLQPLRLRSPAALPTEILGHLTLTDDEGDDEGGGEEDHNNDGENNPPPLYTGTRLSEALRYSVPVNDIVVVQAPSAPGERPVHRMMRTDHSTEGVERAGGRITSAVRQLSELLHIHPVRPVQWEDPQRTQADEHANSECYVIQKMDAPKPATELHGLIAEALDNWDQVRNGWATDWPHEFMCALSLHAMRDPVCCADGYMYERVHIEHHILYNGISPRTMLLLSHTHVYPSVTIRQLMECWVEKALHVPKDTTLEVFLRQRLESIKKAKEQVNASEVCKTVV